MKMIVIGSPNFIIIKIFISAPLMCLQSPGECCVCMYVCLCMPTSLLCNEELFGCVHFQNIRLWISCLLCPRFCSTAAASSELSS